jgi:hypothetical protein
MDAMRRCRCAVPPKTRLLEMPGALASGSGSVIRGDALRIDRVSHSTVAKQVHI